MNKQKRKIALGVLLIMAYLSACAVQPWERGNLAKPHMSIDANEMQSSFRGHGYGSREAATSGNAGQGGGCGCY